MTTQVSGADNAQTTPATDAAVTTETKVTTETQGTPSDSQTQEAAKAKREMVDRAELDKAKTKAEALQKQLDEINQAKLKEANDFKTLFEQEQKKTLNYFKTAKMAELGVSREFADMINGDSEEAIVNSATKIKSFVDAEKARIEAELKSQFTAKTTSTSGGAPKDANTPDHKLTWSEINGWLTKGWKEGIDTYKKHEKWINEHRTEIPD